MSRAAEVMVQHVENLKRHHMREHAELEEMKRLIQQNSRNRQLAETQGEVGSAAGHVGLHGVTLRIWSKTPLGGQCDPAPQRLCELGTRAGDSWDPMTNAWGWCNCSRGGSRCRAMAAEPSSHGPAGGAGHTEDDLPPDPNPTHAIATHTNKVPPAGAPLNLCQA